VITSPHPASRHSANYQFPHALRKTLVDAIRQEYEYNISQQVYVSDKIWNNIVSAKSQVVSMINKVTAEMDENATAADLSRKLIELEMTGDIFPTKAAILLLKHEAARNF